MNTFKNAFGKIDYTLTNDYMFRAVEQLQAEIQKLKEDSGKEVN